MDLSPTVARAFMRAAGMKPGLIDAILELGGRVTKAQWTRSVMEGGLTVWRYAAATPEGNFDITLRITAGPLAEKIGEVLPSQTLHAGTAVTAGAAAAGNVVPAAGSVQPAAAAGETA